MNILTITILLMASAAFAVAVVLFRASFTERDRGRASHLSGLDAKRAADEYRSAGRVMFQNALASYEEGQQFWQAATVALLDAKRREARVEEMLEAIGQPVMVPDPADGNVDFQDRKEAV